MGDIRRCMHNHEAFRIQGTDLFYCVSKEGRVQLWMGGSNFAVGVNDRGALQLLRLWLAEHRPGEEFRVGY